MSVEKCQTMLGECFHGSDDPNVKQAADTANQYTELFKTGQISKEEYLELLQDIERTNNINKAVHNQKVLEHMNVAINGLISLAKLV